MSQRSRYDGLQHVRGGTVVEMTSGHHLRHGQKNRAYNLPCLSPATTALAEAHNSELEGKDSWKLQGQTHEGKQEKVVSIDKQLWTYS